MVIWLTITYWMLIGAAFGSFVNVIVYRLPQGISLLWPPSHCPACKSQLGMTENVPVLGWLWLGGRCRHCGAAIHWRYPLVEVVGAILFGLVAWKMQASFLTPASFIDVAAWGCLVTLLLALSLIDLDTMELPDELTRAGILGGLLFRTFGPVLATGTWASGPPGLMDGLYGLLLGLGLFDLIGYLGERLLGKEAMGGGDAKLAAMLGVWLGWQGLLVALGIGFCLGAVAGVVGLATGQLKREQAFPFGPFLACGGIAGLLFGEILIASYMRLIY